MNPVTGVFLLIIAALLLYTGVQLCQAIISNYHRAGELRRHLAYRIKTLPMFRMMQQQDIPLQYYLHYQSISDIERQVRRCESCNKKEFCSKELGKSPAEHEYCENDPELEEIRISLAA